VHRIQDSRNWIADARSRLALRRAEKPTTKAGQIRTLWPDIEAALEAGQSMKPICAWLAEDAGISLGVKSLTSYISRIRRRQEARIRSNARIDGRFPTESKSSAGRSDSPTTSCRRRPTPYALRHSAAGHGEVRPAPHFKTVEVRSRVATAETKRLDFHVLTASDAVEALEVGRRHAASIDLLLTDVHMPRGGGLELARALGGERPNMKIMVMSGEDIRLPHPTLRKPFELEDLVVDIASILTTA